MEDIIKSLKPKGIYAKTDISGYSDLSPSKVRAALLSKDIKVLDPIFDLIADKDSSVGAELSKRISTLTNKFFTHNLGEEENLNIEEIIKASIQARIYGYGILEMYIDNNSKIGLACLDKEFISIKEDKLMLKSGKSEFEAKEPKFIVLRQKPALIKVVWITYAKHFVLSNYLKFTDFLGVPPLIGNSSSGDEKIIESMAEALKNIKSGSYAVLGPTDLVKVLEGKGTQEDFLEFVRYCDSEIAKVINGSVLSSNAGTSGSYAMSQTHESNRAEILADDAKYAIKSVNEIYAKLNKKPNLNIQIEKDKDLLQRAQILQILAPLGYTINPEEIAKEFDLPLPNRKKESNCKTCKACNNKKMNLDKIDEATDSLNLNVVQGHLTQQLNTILQDCNSYEDALNKFIKNNPNIKISSLEEIMFKAIANANLLGLMDA